MSVSLDQISQSSIVCSSYKYVIIINIQDYRPFKTWRAHQAHILWLGVMTDSHLISYGRRESVKIWKSGCEVLLHEIPVNHEGFCKPDLMSGLFAVPSGKNSIQMFNVSQMTSSSTAVLLPLFNLSTTNDEGAVMAVKFLSTSEPNLLVAAYETGFISIWSCGNIRNETRLKDMPTCIAHDAQRRRILVGSASSTINIFDDEQLQFLHQVPLTNPGINCIAIRPKFFVTGGWDKRLRLFSSKTLKPLCVLQLHEQDLNALVFTTDGLLACASSDAMISLWDLYNS